MIEKRLKKRKKEKEEERARGTGSSILERRGRGCHTQRVKKRSSTLWRRSSKNGWRVDSRMKAGFFIFREIDVFGKRTINQPHHF